MIKRNVIPVLICLLAVLASCKKNNTGAFNPSAPILIDSFIPTSGGGGTEILISGSNFSMDTAQMTVTVNGNTLKVIAIKQGQMMAIVPVKCGSGPIVVKVGSDSVASTGIFNYTFTRTVSTWAGNGTAGFANGAGTAAEFNFNGANWYRMMGIAVDTNLNVYVADPGNACIRKIDSLGNVTTFCGSPGNPGFVDGQGTAAQFSIPYDVAVDAAGNVWSADPGNGDIRKITPGGLATTWTLCNPYPWTVSVDPTTGYPYYTANTSPGTVFQVAAQWGGTPVITGIDDPGAIRFDRSGNLFAVGNGDNEIHKYSAGTWSPSIVAGSGSAGYVDGAATVAEFSQPWGLAIDAGGNLYVAGNGTDGSTTNPDQAIRYITEGTWAVSTFAGSGTAGDNNGVGAVASFSCPTGVAVDKNGTVYVLDKNNNCIRKVVSE
jgi:hypothetical protein